MKAKNKKVDRKKKVWTNPQLTRYGSVEKITLKGYGIFDGSGLAPSGTHPSM